jgi:hypothetical protein
MNKKFYQLYNYLKEEGMTPLSAKDFYNKYSSGKNFKELYSYLKGEGMTPLSESDFQASYFPAEEQIVNKQKGSSKGKTEKRVSGGLVGLKETYKQPTQYEYPDAKDYAKEVLSEMGTGIQPDEETVDPNAKWRQVTKETGAGELGYIKDDWRDPLAEDDPNLTPQQNQQIRDYAKSGWAQTHENNLGIVKDLENERIYQVDNGNWYEIIPTEGWFENPTNITNGFIEGLEGAKRIFIDSDAEIMRLNKKFSKNVKISKEGLKNQLSKKTVNIPGLPGYDPSKDRFSAPSFLDTSIKPTKKEEPLFEEYKYGDITIRRNDSTNSWEVWNPNKEQYEHSLSPEQASSLNKLHGGDSKNYPIVKEYLDFDKMDKMMTEMYLSQNPETAKQYAELEAKANGKPIVWDDVSQKYVISDGRSSAYSWLDLLPEKEFLKFQKQFEKGNKSLGIFAERYKDDLPYGATIEELRNQSTKRLWKNISTKATQGLEQKELEQFLSSSGFIVTNNPNNPFEFHLRIGDDEGITVDFGEPYQGTESYQTQDKIEADAKERVARLAVRDYLIKHLDEDVFWNKYEDAIENNRDVYGVIDYSSFDEKEQRILKELKQKKDNRFNDPEAWLKFQNSDRYKDYINEKKTKRALDKTKIRKLYSKSKSRGGDVYNTMPELKERLYEKDLKEFQTDINEEIQNFESIQNAYKTLKERIDKDEAALKQQALSLPALTPLQTIYEKELEDLENRKKTLYFYGDQIQRKAEQIYQDSQQVQYVTGKYFTELQNLKEDKGSFLGGVWNSVLGGLSDVAYTLDITKGGYQAESNAERKLKRMTPEEKRRFMISSGAKTDKQAVNYLANEKIRDDKYRLKEAVFDAVGSETTQEYLQSKDRGFLEQSINGVFNSLPAMAGSIIHPGFGFTTLTAHAYSGIEDEMLNNPALKFTSAEDRNLVALPYAIGMGILEEMGLSKIFKPNPAAKSIIMKSIKGTLKETTEETTKKAFKKTLKDKIKSNLGKYGYQVVGGALVEFETGATQTLVLDIGYKNLINEFKSKGNLSSELTADMDWFETPDSAADIFMETLEGGLSEAIGGAIMTSVSSATPLLAGGDLSLYEPADLEFMKAVTTDSYIRKSVIANLKSEMINGQLTRPEAQNILDSYDKVGNTMKEIPDILSTEQQVEASNLILEKKRLESDIEGKNESLVAAQKQRISEIDSQLKKLSEDAFQSMYTELKETPVEEEVVEEEVVEEAP